MKNLKLKTDFNIFLTTTNLLIEDGLLLSKISNKKVSLNVIKATFTKWLAKVHKSIDYLFSDNDYLKFDIGSTFRLYDKWDYELKTNSEIKEAYIEDLKNKIDSLKRLITLVEVCDVIREPLNTNFNNRGFLSVQDKMDLLIVKLKSIKGKGLILVNEILEGNGIHLSEVEVTELIEELVKKGFVKYHDRMGPSVIRITVKGELYVEKKLTKKIEREANVEMNNKIDLIIHELQKLGLGQEIIFSEIEEMRGLYSKVPKKNWIQILKGKIVELSVEKIIDSQTAKQIFETITSESFSFLKTLKT